MSSRQSRWNEAGKWLKEQVGERGLQWIPAEKYGQKQPLKQSLCWACMEHKKTVRVFFTHIDLFQRTELSPDKMGRTKCYVLFVFAVSIHLKEDLVLLLVHFNLLLDLRSFLLWIIGNLFVRLRLRLENNVLMHWRRQRCILRHFRRRCAFILLNCDLLISRKYYWRSIRFACGLQHSLHLFFTDMNRKGA